MLRSECYAFINSQLYHGLTVDSGAHHPSVKALSNLQTRLKWIMQAHSFIKMLPKITVII